MLHPALVLFCTSLLPAQQTAPTEPRDPARAFFAAGEVLRIDITLAAADRQRLRETPREYSEATVHVRGQSGWPQVGIKLKGAAGSFREIDDQPAFTVHLGKFDQPHRLRGLQRFHLNNCVQDDSRLCEWLGHEVFTAAGLPAPRVSHARVWLDGKDLGLYVLREAFDRQFLQRVFGHTKGNLYDGGFCQDIDSELEKDSGDGPDDHGDLRALLTLCQGVDRNRSGPLAAAIDVEALLDFLALEAMLGHWDGYGQNRNNYRLWCATAPGRALFLPHGMDQLLGDSEASVLAHPPAIVASAVLQQPTFRKRYRDRLKVLAPLLDPQRLRPRLEARQKQLATAWRDAEGEAPLRQEEAVRSLLDRLAARHKNLLEQVRAPEPKPLHFPGDRPIALRKWHPAAESDQIELDKKGFQGTATLHIACKKRGEEPLQAAWRTSVLLGPGRYRLSAGARCEQVESPPKDEDGSVHGGVVLRVLGATSERLFGSENWRALLCEFEVTEFQRDVELALDLRAFTGRAWFRLDSLQLAKLPD